MNLPTVPEGWTTEPAGKAHIVLRYPDAGCVTIDWEKRGFRGGLSMYGRMTSTEKYAGRGWRQRLVDDAVAWLSEIYATRSTP